eukprot:5913178-Amphidinium_carterae.2
MLALALCNVSSVHTSDSEKLVKRGRERPCLLMTNAQDTLSSPQSYDIDVRARDFCRRMNKNADKVFRILKT